MAVRNVVTPSGRRVRGYFPSRKMGRLIAWESQLERDAILLLEFSPGVLRYREQPERVHFQLDGDAALYIPDFELELADGQMMHVEVKPAAKLEKPDIALRFEAIARHYARIGRGLRILTEAHIRRTPLLQNLQLLAYHLGRHDQAEQRRLLDALWRSPAQTVDAAAAVLGGVKFVYRLLAAGCYRCDLDQPVSSATPIRPYVKEVDHASLLF